MDEDIREILMPEFAERCRRARQKNSEMAHRRRPPKPPRSRLTKEEIRIRNRDYQRKWRAAKRIAQNIAMLRSSLEVVDAPDSRRKS